MSIAPFLLPTYTYDDYEIWEGDLSLEFYRLEDGKYRRESAAKREGVRAR